MLHICQWLRLVTFNLYNICQWKQICTVIICINGHVPFDGYWIELFYYESTCKLDGKPELSNSLSKCTLACIFNNFDIMLRMKGRPRDWEGEREKWVKIHKTVWHIQSTKIMAHTSIDISVLVSLDITLYTHFENKTKQNKSIALSSIENDAFRCIIQYSTLDTMCLDAFEFTALYRIVCIDDR